MKSMCESGRFLRIFIETKIVLFEKKIKKLLKIKNFAQKPITFTHRFHGPILSSEGLKKFLQRPIFQKFPIFGILKNFAQNTKFCSKTYHFHTLIS